jgi:hypothetical protein
VQALEAAAVEMRKGLGGMTPNELPLAALIGNGGRSIVGVAWDAYPLSRVPAAALDAGVVDQKSLRELGDHALAARIGGPQFAVSRAGGTGVDSAGGFLARTRSRASSLPVEIKQSSVRTLQLIRSPPTSQRSRAA